MKSSAAVECSYDRTNRSVYCLQSITILWMIAECAVSLYAASTSRSVALLVFGADSVIELFSASVVLISALPSFHISRSNAARWAGMLLFALAGVIALIAITNLIQGKPSETSRAGIGITIVALMVMPALAWLKRRAAGLTANRALAADAVQSATCAYLAVVTLIGLVVNAVFHIRWIDSAAALAALPVLILEGRRALQSETCSCC